MKILLLGKNGQVGWELQRSLALLGEVLALDRNSQDYCGNLANLAGLAKAVRQIKPFIIVNAAAYTDVDKAESETKLAKTINTDAVAVLAQEAKTLKAWLVHYSTDYVFAGNGTSLYKEDATTNPLSVYGASKLAGEQAIQNSGCQHLIFRTSWVYGVRGNNFAKTILRLATERDNLVVINDQIGVPTGADLLADVTAHTLYTVQQQAQLSGLYHLVASGETSWHGYASYVIETAQSMGENLKTSVATLAPVSANAFLTVAKRPNNSRMSSKKIRTNFALTLPHWQVGVKRMLVEILEK